MPRILRLVCCILSLALSCLATWFSPSAQAASPLPDDAYIWQRKWTPEVTGAMHASADLVHGWHVLAAEYVKAGDGYPEHGCCTSAARPGRKRTYSKPGGRSRPCFACLARRCSTRRRRDSLGSKLRAR